MPHFGNRRRVNATSAVVANPHQRDDSENLILSEHNSVIANFPLNMVSAQQRESIGGRMERRQQPHNRISFGDVGGNPTSGTHSIMNAPNASLRISASR